MADPSTEAASSSAVSVSDIPVAPTIRDEPEKNEDFIEPDKKRRKLLKGDGKNEQKLEHRLGGILCCAVCLDLPRAAVYQVCHSHSLQHATNNITSYLSHSRHCSFGYLLTFFVLVDTLYQYHICSINILNLNQQLFSISLL